MKNILKISLLMTILIFVFLLVSGTNVNAATIVSFQSVGGAALPELDFGSIPYESQQTRAFQIKNNTAAPVTISDLQFTNTSKFEIVGTPLTTISATGTIDIIVKNKTDLDASTTAYTDILTFKVNGSEDVSFPVKVIINPKKVVKPTVTYTYTYTGQEYTFDFTGFNDSYMTITGPKAGTAVGDYDVEISFKNTQNNYTWTDGSKDAVPLTVTINKGTISDPVYDPNAATGAKLSTVALPQGWTWDDPNAIIETGGKLYQASYVDTTGNYKDASARGLLVNGKTQYTVTIPTGTNFYSTPSANFTMFKGETKTVSLVVQSGYLFTSIKLNGIEMITTKLDSYDLKIENINENQVIKVEVERIIITPENAGEIIKFRVGSEDSIKFKFDYDYDVFNINAFRINGKTIPMEDVNKNFKFTKSSVLMEITNEYLATLKPGTYNIEMDLELGELMLASFVVEEEIKIENPKTSDNIMIYSGMALLATIGIAGVFVARRFK